jgi:hypothetical protein
MTLSCSVSNSTSLNRMSEAQRNLDESARAKKIFDAHMAKVNAARKDDHGISGEMIESMVQTVAEGLHTGSTDMRSLLYCAYRNAREIQKKTES